MIIAIPPNGGMVPKLSPTMLPIGGAVKATNVDLRSGNITPLKDTGPSVGSGDKSIYYDHTTDSWRSWPVDVDVVRSPISQKRIIYTDGSLPKISDGTVTVPLGLPSNIVDEAVMPAPTAKAVALSELSPVTAPFSLAFHWFYESTTAPVGVRYDADASAIAVDVTTLGKEYSLTTIPSRGRDTPSTAHFIMWAEVYDRRNNYMGQIIPSPSASSQGSYPVIDGASLTGVLTISGTVAKLKITADSSNAVNFQQVRKYVYTWARDWRVLTGDSSDIGIDEGAPSAESSQIAVDPTSGVKIGRIPENPNSPVDYGITHAHIYRTITGTTGTQYVYVDSIPVGTTTYTDTFTDSDVELNGPLRSTAYDAPPSDLTGLRFHPGGFLVGFSKSFVYFSEPYQPHAWPSYSIACDNTVVGLGIVRDTVVVVTEGNPILISGNSPLSMGVTRVNNSQSGTAKRAVVETGNAVIYSTPAGLVESPSGVVLTASLYTKDQWQALGLASMQIVWSDNKLLIFTDSGLIILRNDGGPEITDSPDIIAGSYIDPATDTLYLSVDGDIVPWLGGDARNYVYHTKDYASPEPVSMSVYRLTSDAGGSPITMSLYADGSLCYRDAIIDGDAHWLPCLPRGRRWSVMVEGSRIIRELLVSDSLKAL